MIITISGKAGSGKSTIAKMLAKKLSYSHHSIGDLQRDIARELGLTIEELGELEKKDDKYDRMLDEKQKNMGKEEDDFVIDGRLSSHFIPKAYKIFLDVDLDEAIKRRLGQDRDTENFDDSNEAKRSILKREKTNQERWIEYYKYDFLDMDNYDLIINTNNLTPNEILEKILEEIKKN